MEEFKEKEFQDKEKDSNQESEQEKNTRLKLPRKNQLIGVIVERLGGNKMRVNCSDKKTRISRVPGRLKRKLWLRPRDVVIVEMWELDKEKADVIFKYNPNQINLLKKQGYLEKETREF